MPLSAGFISQDWSSVGENMYPNGCTWYRCILPADALNKRGNAAHVGLLAVSDSGRIAVAQPKKNIVVGHQIIVFKLAMHLANLEAAMRAKDSGQKIVVDIDDWFDGLPETNKAFETTDPKKHPENNRNIYFALIEMADALICSTRFLYDFYSKKHPGKPIFLVENAIDVDRWTPKQPPRGKPVIGWVGATPWRSNDLEQLSGFFNAYLESRALKFHHAGHISTAPSAASLLGLTGNHHTHEGMQPITQLPRLFNNLDIGIVPLNNIPFNYAKSYLKGLEYAAAGIPFVCSYSPEYQSLTDAGVGRLANSATDWEYHLDELLDAEMWLDEREYNRELIMQNYSIDKRADEWEKVFTAIMDIK